MNLVMLYTKSVTDIEIIYETPASYLLVIQDIFATQKEIVKKRSQ